MKTLVLGFFILVGIMFYTAMNVSASTLFQLHSIILVIGGTLAVFFISTSPKVVTSVYHSSREMMKTKDGFEGYEKELVELSQKQKLSVPSKNILIQYAADLWASGIDPELFIILTSQKRKEIDSKSLDAVQALKNLAKYPPALGMIGTVIGMIALFAQLDSSKENIGSNLSLAMTATFFGLLLTNAIISPLADRLHVHQLNQQRSLDMVYEILLLINRGEPTALIKEELNERTA